MICTSLRNLGMSRTICGSFGFHQAGEYPDDFNFERYFERSDFLKAMKAGTLRPFDGTVAEYPDFRLSFYRHVHIQRGSVLDKITMLDALMPTTIALTSTFVGWILPSTIIASGWRGCNNSPEGPNASSNTFSPKWLSFLPKSQWFTERS